MEHLKSDRVLARVIDRIGPLKLTPRRTPPYQSLVHAIIHQQLNGRAARTILNRFLALFGEGDFPDPATVAAMELDRLRAVGLSRAKAAYIQDVARHDLDGSLPSLDACHRLTDAELVRELTAIKGVGQWTVEMLLIFNLGRPDVLPVHDLGVRRGYQVAYTKRRMPEPKELQRHGAKWAPYRSTAALYLWRMADQPDGGEW
jgi:DNA-3-methyladenine glycosylase II